MKNERIILLGGLALIATGILYPALFTYLAIRFGYPDVLEGRAQDVLPELLAGGRTFRTVWAAYGLLPLLLIPAGAGAFYALRRHMEGGMRIALHLSVLSAMALMVGLLRWPSVHWELALFHRTADAPQRETVGAIFDALNTYLGNFIGEFLGEGLMHGFLLLTAMAMRKSGAFPAWVGWTGIAVSGLSLVGVFRNVHPFAESVQDLANVLMLFPIWLVILGIGLTRYAFKTEGE